jgi:hypothetical protein
LPYDLSVPAGHCDTHGTDEKLLAGGEASPTWLQDHEACDCIDFVNGLVWGNIYRKPWISPLSMELSCKCSLKPIYIGWVPNHQKKHADWVITVSALGWHMICDDMWFLYLISRVAN